MVNVLTEILINRPLQDVAEYSANPDNAPEWYVNIHAAEWETEPPLEAGSRITFRARFLRKNLVYTYEIKEYEPGKKMVMETAQGPFPMKTTYTWDQAGKDQTLMTLRNEGNPKGFSALVSPLMSGMMRKANTKDLLNLKRILETGR